jgi:hypothetical protein
MAGATWMAAGLESGVGIGIGAAGALLGAPGFAHGEQGFAAGAAGEHLGRQLPLQAASERVATAARPTAQRAKRRMAVLPRTIPSRA